MGDLADLKETELARLARKTGDPRVVSRTTAVSGDGKEIEWFSLKAGRQQVTLRRGELEGVAKALLDALGTSPPTQARVANPPPRANAPEGPRSIGGAFGGRPSKPMPARFASSCIACNATISPGESIVLIDRKAKHVECPKASAPAAHDAPADGGDFDEDIPF